MATALFWIKYVVLSLTLNCYPTCTIPYLLCVVTFVVLDIWHGSLLEKRGRSTMLTMVVQRAVRKIVREESGYARSS